MKNLLFTKSLSAKKPVGIDQSNNLTKLEKRTLSKRFLEKKAGIYRRRFYRMTASACMILPMIFMIHLTLIPTGIFAFANEPVLKIIQDDFDKQIRAGRDLIAKEEWTNAANIFLELIAKYPSAKSADAALYWLALCYSKSGKFAQANSIIDRLFKNYPDSSWRSDAQVLRLQLLEAVGGQNKSKLAQKLSESVEKGAGSRATPPNPDGSLDNPLEREDEVRLSAFQTLLEIDFKRAIGAAENTFKNPQASDSLKTGILLTLRNFQFPLSQRNNAEGDLPILLRNALLRFYQNESHYSIKSQIAQTLVTLGDKEANDSLQKIYFSEQDREMKTFIILAFGRDVYEPRSAINLTEFETDKFEKLWGIFQAEKDVELRIFALSNLKRTKNWLDKLNILETLFRTYDAEKDDGFKVELIRIFASTENKRTLDKLMQIARSDENRGMRVEAFRQLQEIKTPEVITFLEDLVNKSP
jgi:tetratricopeptide (TPR) repeat protein